MFLLISKHLDDFVNQVIDCLEEDYIRLGDLDNFSIEKIELSNTFSFVIKDQYNKLYDLSKVTAIWFNGCIDPYIEIPYENKSFTYLFNTFVNSVKVNKIGKLSNEFEINKFDVLVEAKKIGFLIPETAILNNKKELLNFYNKFKTNNGIISKRIIDNQHIYKFNDYLYNFNLTFAITEEIIHKMASNFSISLFQECIVSEFEIRVVYVNDTFYAMSVHPLNIDIDYRTNFDNNKLRMIPFNLPTKVKNKLRKLFKNLNLNFGSADLMFYKNKFYFLEINTTGQISFLNNSCNYYIEYEFLKIFNNETPK
jgi:hypothetical protein